MYAEHKLQSDMSGALADILLQFDATERIAWALNRLFKLKRYCVTVILSRILMCASKRMFKIFYICF